MYKFNAKKKSEGSSNDNAVNYAASNGGAEQKKRSSGGFSVKALSRICAALACLTVFAIGFGVFSGVTSSERYAAVEAEMSDVVVALADIDEGHVITAADVSLAPVSTLSVPNGAYDSVDMVVGRVAGHYMPAKTVVSDQGLSGSHGATLADRIGEGHVAITVAVTQESGVAGLVHQGDHVTILVLGDASSGDASAVPAARGVLVLAADSMLDEYSSVYTSLTLEVTEQQAIDIATAKSAGVVTCVLEPTSVE